MASRQVIRGGYATTARSGRVEYEGEFRRSNSAVFTSLFGRASGIEILRFYGFGNETSNAGPDQSYKARQDQLVLEPSVGVFLTPRLTLSLGPRVKYAKTDLAVASRYAELMPEIAIRDRIFSRIAAEHRHTVELLASITGEETLLFDNPTLARSIRDRFPYLDPLNHLQVELLRRYRSGQTDERTRRAIHLTINGLAAGLRNSG